MKVKNKNRKVGIIANKRGGKIISIYWFVILTIIAGGIVMMTNAFYGTPYDVRNVEAEILSSKIADCIYFGGKMNTDLISPNGVFKKEFDDNFLDRCSLNFDYKNEFSGIEYYAGVNFYLTEEQEVEESSLSAGNKNWIGDCEIEEGQEKLVQCYKNEFWANGDAGKTHLIKILTIVKKTKENIK